MRNINFQLHIPVLHSLELFRDFSGQELESLFKNGNVAIREYDKNQIIHLQNEKCQTMGIIMKGRVAIQKIDESGNVLTVHVLAERDILGANLIFSSRNHYPMTVSALSKSFILQLNRELVLDLCQTNTNFMLCFLKELSDKATALTDKIHAISLKTIRQQIVDFIEYESRLQQSPVIRLPMSKKELAERLGIQRTSLSRELQKMKKEGLLEYDSMNIHILKHHIGCIGQ